MSEAMSNGNPIDNSVHEFVVPTKEVKSQADMGKWEISQAYNDYVQFLMAMNSAIKGKMLNNPSVESEVTKGIISTLDTLDNSIEEFPPIDQPQRFGNKAFRMWFEKLKENGSMVLKQSLPEEYHPAVTEIAVYFVESFGNSTRIDYGSGHEMAFAMFLCCLYKIGALKKEDAEATVLKIFMRYLLLVRRLQSVYRMEPAGSQGVWNLDDYHFLPFYWGAAQLCGSRVKTATFPDRDTAEAYAPKYMFHSFIAHIHKVKTGPFAEHSNQLWNISAVPNWEKVNSGLMKMYKAEVLAKFPIIQHVFFGSLLSLSPVFSADPTAISSDVKL